MPLGTTPDVDLRYAYDARDMRVVKTAVDGSGAELHSVYVFGSLELRRAHYDLDGEEAALDYERSATTESPYLDASGVRLARVSYVSAAPSTSTGKLHVFFELGDHLGSTTTVLDRATSEVVEASTYQAYGGADSDYRPGRWGEFREDYRFTGKEEDVEVGLQYFGKRFFVRAVGRWASADPLAVHAPGSGDLNLYAYVHGRLLKAVDPVGLEEKPADQPATNGTQPTAPDPAKTTPRAAPTPAPEPTPPASDGTTIGKTGRQPTALERYVAAKMNAAVAAAKSGLAGAWLLATEAVSSIINREPDYEKVAQNTKQLAAIQQGAEIAGLAGVKTEATEPDLIPQVTGKDLRSGSGGELFRKNRAEVLKSNL